MGYKKMAITLSLLSDTTINWQLNAGIDLVEVEVISGKPGNEKRQFGANTINMQSIQMVPSMLGTPDVIKTLQLFAGVKTGNEGTAGIQVRGGSHDQNLILLDGIPVYNTNHIFGYLSAFQTKALKDVKFFKRSIPARYGGRLSSIVDISMKEGNLKKSSGNFSVSPVSGSLMIEGPIKTDTASFLLASRRTWLDLPIRAYKTLAGDDERFGYSFYDLNGKINWIINSQNRIYISHYNGRDAHFTYLKNDNNNKSSRFSFNWENYTSLLRWNCILPNNLFVNTSVYHSLYRFGQISEYTGQQSFKEIVHTSLEEFAIKGDFDLNLKNNRAKFGYQISHFTFKPELVYVKANENMFNKNSSAIAQNLTISTYVENNWEPNHKVNFNYGIRSHHYQAGSTNYWFIEPRASFNFNATSSSTIHAAIQQTTQPLHLLTNTALNMPSDLWVPVTGNIRPAKAWQFNLGADMVFQNKDYNMSLDLYYKPVKDIIQYKQGISLIKSNYTNWYDLVDVGNGLNYGVEMTVEKTGHKLTGWVNYTLAWAWLKFDNINNNQYFPFKYDRRHDINILINYYLTNVTNKKCYFSLTFKYASGNAVTLPIEVSEGITAPGTVQPGRNSYYPYTNPEYYPHPNNYRMPAFHHLDISYSTMRQTAKGNEFTWKFSVYNLYNRLNPYYFVAQNDKMFKISMLPIIPSVVFNYRW
ncbi:MAG: TonB-dependent receptor plug domain-containing protein [Mariniphaga sp.]|nr:TonB-dependent receptor plug domain-containing protein [Mariniphaga sp.]